MDAWIKGIRYLTVIYYNYVEAEAARELLQAADIMGMTVRVGLEFACPFRGRYVHFVWVPRGFTNADGFLEFLTEAPVQHLMQKGREASAWQQNSMYMLLENWNTYHRLHESARFAVEFPPLPEAQFREFVGTGQASLLHLAECIHVHCRPLLLQRLGVLRRELAEAKDQDRADIEKQIQLISEIEPSYFADSCLAPEHNPDLPDPNIPSDSARALRWSFLLCRKRNSGSSSVRGKPPCSIWLNAYTCIAALCFCSGWACCGENLLKPTIRIVRTLKNKYI